MMSIWSERRQPDSICSWRHAYARDRARIIHSAFFRRLQGKTQVLAVGESDFYRTRLTHTIEVAQIAAAIVEYVQERHPDAIPPGIYPHTALIESISLMHDIGHPPFGHSGEVALNYMMHSHGGFEGNAQTLRIATRLGDSSPQDGLNLTRRTLLGLIKYPCLYSDVVADECYDHDQAPQNIASFAPPKCIYDCDQPAFDFVCEPLSAADKDKLCSHAAGEGKHSRPVHKALDTSIMELADDIAYGVHDLEDSVALRLVTQRQWEADVAAVITDPGSNCAFPGEIEALSTDLFSEQINRRNKAISTLVYFFVENVRIVKQSIFDEPLLDFNARMETAALNTLNIFKTFINDRVILTPEVQMLEYRGQQMIIRIFEALLSNPETLLHRKYYQRYQHDGEIERHICDYIAGTTDDYLTRLYQKIFLPSTTGSIFDRL